MKKILIIGAGGFGREILQFIRDINAAKPTWEVIGFLDDDIHTLDKFNYGVVVVGTIKDWVPNDDEEYALAIGTPATKRKVVQIMKAKGAKFATVIHPTAMLSGYASHGDGLIMYPYSRLGCDSVVGDYVTILSSLMGHDTTIGDYSVISCGCNIIRNVTIKSDVFVAAGVSISQDVTIGEGAYLGLGSVILKDVPPGAKMFGNPARAIPEKQSV